MIEQLLSFTPLWFAGAAVIAVPVTVLLAHAEPSRWRHAHRETTTASPERVPAATAPPARVEAALKARAERLDLPEAA